MATDWLIKAALNEIENQMSRLYWNKNQEHMESPFSNTGAKYINDTFAVRAYSWVDDEEEDLPNFEYKELKVYWYKHSNRGLIWFYNNEKYTLPPSDFLEEMIENCVESLEKDWGIK